MESSWVSHFYLDFGMYILFPFTAHLSGTGSLSLCMAAASWYPLSSHASRPMSVWSWGLFPPAVPTSVLDPGGVRTQQSLSPAQIVGCGESPGAAKVFV